MTNETSAAPMLSQEIKSSILHALEEDVASGDATTDSIVSADAKAIARIIAKQDGVVSGLEVARTVFLVLDGEMTIRSHVSDGKQVVKDQVLLALSGSARALLTGERTALNFIGRMSGMASPTNDGKP